MVITPESTRPDLACTIKTLGGNFVVEEPVVGRWYTSVDNRKGLHALGMTAKYLGEGDFLSNEDEYLEDACGVFDGTYLLLLRPQDSAH